VSEVSEFKTLGDLYVPYPLLALPQKAEKKQSENDFSTMETDMRDSFEVNVLSVLKIIHVFLPLIRASPTKKIITISTGMADINMINDYEVAYAAPYSISKAAVNAVMAKYNALYKSEGILFLSVSPGYVATERNGVARSDEDMAKMGIMVSKFAAYAPHLTRPLTPEESVTAVLSVAEKASVEGGSGGAFVSHLGTKRWL
jgi:NAD(P)-dependent dehydrogenase (short-subunit alcohol dehydrogenase family)